MNNKGFSLIELLATIVVLSIITGIVVISVNSYFGDAKDNTEEVFVDTVKDAMDIYISSSSAKGLSFSQCSNELSKTHGNVKVYKAVTTFDSVINSEYHPITQNDLVNPANKDVTCANASEIEIEIYHDGDYIYYYSINRDEFECLKNSGIITNLPFIGDTDGDGIKEYYSCN